MARRRQRPIVQKAARFGVGREATSRDIMGLTRQIAEALAEAHAARS